MPNGWIEDSEDLTVFFDNEFTTVCTINGSGGSFQVNGLFDNNYDPMFDSGNYKNNEELEGRNIRLLVRTDKIASVNHRDQVIVRGNPYVVVGIQPLDDGDITSLKLKEEI